MEKLRDSRDRFVHRIFAWTLRDSFKYDEVGVRAPACVHSLCFLSHSLCSYLTVCLKSSEYKSPQISSNKLFWAGSICLKGPWLQVDELDRASNLSWVQWENFQLWCQNQKRFTAIGIFAFSRICLVQWRLYGAYDGCPRSLSCGSQQLDKIPPSAASGGEICIKPALTPRTSRDDHFFMITAPPTQRWPYFYELTQGTAAWPGVPKLYQIGSRDLYQRDPTLKPEPGLNISPSSPPLWTPLAWWC